MLIINHKDRTLQLEGHNLVEALRDLLKELRKLHYYRLQFSKSHALAIATDNVAQYNAF